MTVRRGDYADPDSLPVAFNGADQLLLVSSSDPGADAVSLHRAAIDAAATAGVPRILYTTHQGAAFDTPFGPGRDHAATEQLLADSGVAWTSLRNGFYAHSLNWLMGPWRQTGSIAVPADGAVSWAARRDAAEAAAVILASNGAFDGPTTLTARAAPTFEEIAAIASELTGRTIEVSLMDQNDWVAAHVAAGQKESVARFTLGIYQAASEGFFAGVDPLLGTLLGRQPQTVRALFTRPDVSKRHGLGQVAQAVGEAGAWHNRTPPALPAVGEDRKCSAYVRSPGNCTGTGRELRSNALTVGASPWMLRRGDRPASAPGTRSRPRRRRRTRTCGPRRRTRRARPRRRSRGSPRL